MFVYLLYRFRDHDFISVCVHASLSSALRGADYLMGDVEWSRAYDVPDGVYSWTNRGHRLLIEKRKVLRLIENS